MYFKIPDEIDTMGLIKNACTSLDGCATNKDRRRRMMKSRMDKHIKTKTTARAYKLGKGRVSENK